MTMAAIMNSPDSQLHASAGVNTFHVPGARRQFEEETVVLGRSQLSNAAEALREMEVEAREPAPSSVPLSVDALTKMNIDELRVLAKQLGVANREKIIEQDELVAAIARTL
jgi:hypothetical protein